MSNFIKVSRCVSQGNGSVDYVDKWLNKTEISSIEKCERYPHAGSYFVVMNSGEKFYALLDETALT